MKRQKIQIYIRGVQCIRLKNIALILFSPITPQSVRLIFILFPSCQNLNASMTFRIKSLVYNITSAAPQHTDYCLTLVPDFILFLTTSIAQDFINEFLASSLYSLLPFTCCYFLIALMKMFHFQFKTKFSHQFL